MFNYFKKIAISNRVNDEFLYEYVLNEIETDTVAKGLWAKAIAHSEGNEKKVKPLYMQYRVQDIKDEFTKKNIAYEELKRDTLYKKISSIFTEVNSNDEDLVLSNSKEKSKSDDDVSFISIIITLISLVIIFNVISRLV